MIGHPRMRISNSDRLGKVHLARLKRALSSWRSCIIMESSVAGALHVPQEEVASVLLQLVHFEVLKPCRLVPEEQCWVLDEYGRKILEATVPAAISRSDAAQLTSSLLGHLASINERPDGTHYVQGVAFGPEYFISAKKLPFVPVDVHVRSRSAEQLDARAIEVQLSEFSEHLLVRVSVEQ